MLAKSIRKFRQLRSRTENSPFNPKYPFSNHQKIHMSGILGYVSNLLVSKEGSPQYTVQKTLENAEVRNYQPFVVAETIIQGDHQNAGNKAFHILAGYIFGGNEQKTKIQMTAPVNMQKVGEGEFAVQFVMPSEWKLDTLPKPNDSRVTLKTIPSKKSVAIKYNGGWSENLYREEMKKLQEQMGKKGMNIKNEPIWARYNSPMAPSFLRTNEIIVDL